MEKSYRPLGAASCWEFPSLVVSNLVVCNFYAETLCLRSFAPFCPLLRTCICRMICTLLRSFALFCALLRAFACFCVRLRLERPHLGTSDPEAIYEGGLGRDSGEALHRRLLDKDNHYGFVYTSTAGRVLPSLQISTSALYKSVPKGPCFFTQCWSYL